MCFNTSEQTEDAINLLTEINMIAKIRANLTKSEYVTFNDKAKLPIRVNDQLIYSVDKNKNICVLGSFLESQKLLKNFTEQAIKTL
jgi:argininosuccinate synthase